MIPAWKWGKQEKVEKLILSEEEELMQEAVRTIWAAILSGQAIEEQTDFFKSGAGSMDVTRFVGEKRLCCMKSRNSETIGSWIKFSVKLQIKKYSI